MDKETFRKLLAKGKIKSKREKGGKANWPRIMKRALKDGGIYTTSQFWKKFVRGVVNKGRTKNVLHKWCDENNICARIWDERLQTYLWIFDKELVKLYFEQLSKLKGL